MKVTDPISETFLPVEDDIDFNGRYNEPVLVMSTANARIYRISKAGKTMLLKTPADDSALRLDLLKREYRLAVGLSHQHVASIYTWESASPVGPGILMEYVDGRTLSDFIAEKPALKQRRRVFSQLLEAIDYIHKHGVTHNDLKPGNILVSRANDDVKVIDFGLSDIDGETTQRQLGGTSGYSSPELAARNRNTDMRSDIYSLGVIMRDVFGDKYRRIWRKCIAKDPQKRYRNVESLIKAWNRRLRLPTAIGISAMACVVVAFALIGTLNTVRLKDEVEAYSQSSQELVDTIAALRLDQSTAADSLSKLNSQLTQINQEKALTDSLTDAYLRSTDAVIEKHKRMIGRLSRYEESVEVFRLFNEEMDRNDSTFLKLNPVAGKKIYQQYGQAARVKGATALDALSKRLPPFSNL